MLQQAQNVTGTRMTCTNPECDCELRIATPCPHGTGYRCACGHDFEAIPSG